MKLTFQDQYTIAQEISGLTDATTLIKFKRDINTGGTMFLTELGREYNRHSRTTNLVASQQYYELPEDAQKLKEIIVNTGGWYPPLEQIPDEFAWRQMNMFNITGVPSHYFIRGNDEVGLYPTPSLSVTAGIELVFSPKHVQLTEADTTSTTSSTTVTVTNGSTTLSSSGTIFTPTMVGQWLQTTDGTDERWYQIASYTNTSTMLLENYYQGPSGSSKVFRIGQVMDLPEEYLEAPTDYAMYRHFLRRGSSKSRYSQGKALEFKGLFDEAVLAAKDEYGNTTDSQVINATPRYRVYNNWRGDPPASISA
jgi:hypothetical protein